jgi:4-amino-4-deoxy-L-arabinose transferase-like glycosyltransferase
VLSKLKIDNKAVLLLAIIINSLFGLYPAPLFDEDEGFTAEVAREMLQNREFILLESNFEPRYDKPPLGFWIISGSLYFLGNNELAARLPSILFSAGLIYMIFAFVRKRYGIDKALITCLIVIGTLQFSIMSKAAIADPILYFFMVGAMLSYLEYLESKKLKFFFLFTAGNALAFLTKGPIVLFISAVVVLTSSLHLRSWKPFLAVIGVKQIAAFFAIVLPWFILSYQKVGMLMINDFFFKHNVGRFSNSMEGHSGSYFYFAIVFMAGFLPFSFAHLTTLVKAFKTKLDLTEKVLLVWFIAVFIFFTFSATKLPHYLMLGFFPLVILSTKFFTLKSLKIAKITAAVFVLLVVILPFIASEIAKRIDDIYAQALIAGFKEVFTSNYYFVGGAALVFIIASLKYQSSFGFIIPFLIVINLALINYAALQQGPIRELAKKVNTEIVMMNHYSPSFSFYRRQPHHIRELKTGDYSLGKNIDFRNYETKVLYEKYGTVWVEIVKAKR